VNLPDVDYHHEKYALVALAAYLVDDEGWSSVLMGVAPESLDEPDGPRGNKVPTIDAEQDRKDPKYRYNFYTDTGGIDLVATRPGRTLLVEAKGQSSTAPAGIEQLVGRTVLSMKSRRPDREYAVLIPDSRRWARVVRRAASPVLPKIRVYVVSRRGEIRLGEWGSGWQ
jgi:hypothetical protein